MSKLYHAFLHYPIDEIEMKKEIDATYISYPEGLIILKLHPLCMFYWHKKYRIWPQRKECRKCWNNVFKQIMYSGVSINRSGGRGGIEINVWSEMFLEMLVLQRTTSLIQVQVVFHNKIRTMCQPFNARYLRIIAITFTEINLSQCDIKLWTSGLKGSGVLEGHTYITKTLFPPIKLSHCRTVQSKWVHFS